MPSRAALANDTEYVLALVGLVLLWRLVLRPAARAKHAQVASPLAPWEAPFSDLLFFIWLTLTGGLLGPLIATPLFRPLGWSEDARFILTNVAFELGMLGGIALFRLGLRRERLSLSTPASAIVAGVATFLIAVPFVLIAGLVWQVLMQLCGLPIEAQDVMSQLLGLDSPVLLTAMILIASVAAPITEELIFRAGLFRYARTRVSRWVALLGPACLFATMHWNLATYAQLATLGVIFSLAYERTGRVATPMIAHALFNAHTVLIVLLDPSAATGN